jgi:hypothetical protein
MNENIRAAFILAHGRWQEFCETGADGPKIQLRKF